ncbi:hypothetical protein DL770_001567 [Monosporascus sp. CRB-9-2]|nr:hypothetical protein DL770_001567 [Monosporascus sp. CRB-9-2]
MPITEEQFVRLLRSFADLDFFSHSNTPTIFIVYAHDNSQVGTANANHVHDIIEWLLAIRSRTVSDKSPLLWYTEDRHPDSAPARNILNNQFRLLPTCSSPDSVVNSKRAIGRDGSAAVREQVRQSGNNNITLDRHFVVPFGRNENFVDREPILQQLLQRIPPDANKDDCQRTAIEGLGGVGKTQVAIEAAYRVRDEHPACSIFWVPAIDSISFEKAYCKIGNALDVQGLDDGEADVKLLVKDALSRESIGSWLLIVDNADDLELLFNDPALADYLPFSRKGSILFTIRNHEAAVRLDIGKYIITLQEMNDKEATKLLQTGLKENQTSDTKSTAGLLKFLANLPLAIKQASAYIARTGISTTKYLNYCKSSDKMMAKLLSQDFEARGRYRDINNPIATTWLILFNHISRDMPLAVRYLKFICFLAEKDIPVLLLLPGEDELIVDEAIGILKGYAFISDRDNPDAFDIYRLVRLAMRNWLQKNGEWQEWSINVIQQFAGKYPYPEHKNKDVWMTYLPHGQAVIALREGSVAKEAKTRLLSYVAISYLMLGKYEKAEQIWRQILELREAVLGREDPETLTSMGNLVFVLNRQGKCEEAEQIHRQTLELTKAVLGREDPGTLTSMNDFANVLKSQGRYEEAEQMIRQVLELREAVLGREDPDTLTSMNNLANVLKSQGRYEEAEQMIRQALELREAVLGRENPDILNSMNNLACVLKSQGRYEEAEQIHRQTLELYQKVLGREHPDTLISMHNLAETLRHQGKYDEAEQVSR